MPDQKEKLELREILKKWYQELPPGIHDQTPWTVSCEELESFISQLLQAQKERIIQNVNRVQGFDDLILREHVLQAINDL